MPKIQWLDLPAPLRSHLFERLREREISGEDLYRLKLWRETEPEAPEGPWYKDFGSFTQHFMKAGAMMPVARITFTRM